MKKNISQKGAVSILLAILLLSVLLIIGSGIAVLIIQQIKMSGQMGRSVVAYYAAESGAERCLYELRQNGATSCPFTDVPLSFNTNAKYTVIYNDGIDKIESIGQFMGVSRKVEVSW